MIHKKCDRLPWPRPMSEVFFMEYTPAVEWADKNYSHRKVLAQFEEEIRDNWELAMEIAKQRGEDTYLINDYREFALTVAIQSREFAIYFYPKYRTPDSEHFYWSVKEQVTSYLNDMIRYYEGEGDITYIIEC